MENPLRRKLTNDVQMMLAGHPSSLAASVVADVLASILGFMARDQGEADELCESIVLDLKRTIHDNWAYLREVRAAAMPVAGRG